MCLVFFFNGTATTEIYTYRHTLSRHDARPSCEHLVSITGLDISTASDLIEATQDVGAFVQLSGVLKRTAVKLSKICNDLRLLSSGPRARSEENTSELQSLMRISYAVLCLKKKNTNTTRTIQTNTSNI